MSISLVGPRYIEIGSGAVRRLTEILVEVAVARPLVVTDRPLIEHGVIDGILEQLSARGIAFEIFDDVSPDPTTDNVAALVRAIQAGDHDGLIAIGGGSPMDTAKAAAVSMSDPEHPLSAFKAPHVVSASAIPLVCIPTTAGTGSEMTRFTIITDAATNEKMLIGGPGCVPIAAIVDVDLSLSMPPSITRDTGVDALTHGLEAYLSSRSSRHSDVLAVSGVRRVLHNLPLVWDDPNDLEARAEMMLGATHAGMAFSAASVALIHGMSRPMGAFFHIPHGRANAMLLNAVLRWTRPHALPRIAELAREVGLVGAGSSDVEAADALQGAIAALTAKLDIPTPKSVGVDEAAWFAAVATMSEQAIASGSPSNNPGDPSLSEISALYAEIWDNAH